MKVATDHKDAVGVRRADGYDRAMPLSYAHGASGRPAPRRDDRRQPRADRRPRARRARRSSPATRACAAPTPSSTSAVDRARARPARARPRARRPGRDLVPELRRVGARPVRDGEDRRDPRQHQPGVPDDRARVRAATSRAAALLIARARVQEPRTTWRWSPRSRAGCPRSEAHRVPRLADWDELARGAGAADRGRPARRAPTRSQFDDPINIQYTSGTTGFPKGATLSHHNILNNGFFVGEALRLHARPTASASRCRSTTASAWCSATSRCTTHGACIVVPGAAFEPRAVLEAVEAERCTSLYGVPTMFIAELEHPDFGELRPLELAAHRDHGRLAVPGRGDEQGAVASMHMDEVTICYGMTETSPVSTQTAARRSARAARRHRRPRASRTSRSRSSTPTTGATVPRGEPGELLHARLLA